LYVTIETVDNKFNKNEYLYMGNQVREVKCPPHVNLYQWNASETSNAL